MKGDGSLTMFIIVMIIAYVVNPILGTFLGGIAGWAVGIVYGDHLELTMMNLGLVPGTWAIGNHNFFWDLGCLLGFVGGFFKGFGKP
jgi:hypothetical protein